MNLVLVKVIPIDESKNFTTKPWNVTIEGEVDNPITLSAEEIISLFHC